MERADHRDRGRAVLTGELPLMSDRAGHLPGAPSSRANGMEARVARRSITLGRSAGLHS